MYNPSSPKNYQLLMGRLGLAGNICETGLAGGAAATVVVWLIRADTTGMPELLALKSFMLFVFVPVTILMGLRVLEQVNYYFNNPGVSASDPETVNNTGMVPFWRAAIVVVAVVIYYLLAGIFVVIAIEGF